MNEVENNTQTEQANPLGKRKKNRAAPGTFFSDRDARGNKRTTECIGWLFDKSNPSGICRIVRQTAKSYFDERGCRYRKGRRAISLVRDGG